MSSTRNVGFLARLGETYATNTMSVTSIEMDSELCVIGYIYRVVVIAMFFYFRF